VAESPRERLEPDRFHAVFGQQRDNSGDYMLSARVLRKHSRAAKQPKSSKQIHWLFTLVLGRRAR
jgi:hypothetical protein